MAPKQLFECPVLKDVAHKRLTVAWLLTFPIGDRLTFCAKAVSSVCLVLQKPTCLPMPVRNNHVNKYEPVTSLITFVVEQVCHKNYNGAKCKEKKKKEHSH